MTSYKKDTVVVKSIEDVFKCGKFCGNLKHSERMNSGVMVVEPSETVFKDMISQVDRLPSYTGGDQGFLNSYYADFANSRVYEPDSPLTPEPETQRLSTLYNADVGLYMLANKWMVDEKELRVIHYTLGPLKPWDWWTAWLVKPVEIWQDVRQKLEESLPGTGGGRNPHDQLVVKFLFILPFCLLLFGYYQSCFQISNGPHLKLPSYFGAIAVLICFMSAGVSLAFAFTIIPRQIMPWTGHHQRNISDFDMEATFYWTGMAVIAIITVFSPTILGITALFTKTTGTGTVENLELRTTPRGDRRGCWWEL
ncbi:unnamed protein product [Triticum turgidum subsp. durum]|uniref:Uncharacterized protein n=1 Tax=Triticum turgidum subsp. durum TaxID=4567 RepID=A0A9R1RAT4_TRITD|nr:unnamed protein product [Triticum turgidum subsp. durum]